MKYWRGYLVAGLLAALTAALTGFSKAHSALVDMVYPYVSRLIQTSLADWVSAGGFCLWQVLAILLIALALATVVLMIVFRWNFVQWLGWVLAGVTFLVTLHTGMYGLNSYAGPLADDIRLQTATEPYSASQVQEATLYFRDLANQLSAQVPRNPDGSVSYPSFEELADMAANGFDTLVKEKNYSVFAGSAAPVKELGWANMYTSMGITGVHMPFTGEAAVNPQTPAVALPFVMCHEMCHRTCIAIERDANLGAFLACDANSDPIFRYSGYFMAFRYCFNALSAMDTTSAAAAAQEIYQGIGPELMGDIQAYNHFFAENKNDSASAFADSVNDTYIKASGDENGIASYGQVSDLLVSWYRQEIYLPAHKDEVETFDPLDKNQIDLQTPDTVIGTLPAEGEGS